MHFLSDASELSCCLCGKFMTGEAGWQWLECLLPNRPVEPAAATQAQAQPFSNSWAHTRLSSSDTEHKGGEGRPKLLQEPYIRYVSNHVKIRRH